MHLQQFYLDEVLSIKHKKTSNLIFNIDQAINFISVGPLQSYTCDVCITVHNMSTELTATKHSA